MAFICTNRNILLSHINIISIIMSSSVSKTAKTNKQSGKRIHLSSSHEAAILGHCHTAQRLARPMRHHEMRLSTRVDIVHNHNASGQIDTVCRIDIGSQSIVVLCSGADNFLQYKLSETSNGTENDNYEA